MKQLARGTWWTGQALGERRQGAIAGRIPIFFVNARNARVHDGQDKAEPAFTHQERDSAFRIGPPRKTQGIGATLTNRHLSIYRTEARGPTYAAAGESAGGAEQARARGSGRGSQIGAVQSGRAPRSRRGRGVGTGDRPTVSRFLREIGSGLRYGK